MGLVFNHGKSPPTGKPPDHAELQELATKFRDSLREIGKASGSRLSSWVKEFRLCAKVECGGDCRRLTEALAWYLTKLGQRYTPQAWSASGFRAKFHQIEEAMQRDRQRNPVVTITDQARAVALRASALGFPPAVKAKLPDLAQLVMDRYRPHRANLTKWAESPQPTPLLGLTHLHRTMPGAERYAERYLTEWVHNRVKWAKWNGDIPSLNWTKDHEHLHALIRKLLSEYGASGKAYDKAKEVMGL